MITLFLLSLLFLEVNEEDSGEAILGMEFVSSQRYYYYFKLDSNRILTVLRGTPIPDEWIDPSHQKTLDSIELSSVRRRGRRELSEQEFDEIIRLADTIDVMNVDWEYKLHTGRIGTIIYYNDKRHSARIVSPSYQIGAEIYILHLHDKLIELSPIEISS